MNRGGQSEQELKRKSVRNNQHERQQQLQWCEFIENPWYTTNNMTFILARPFFIEQLTYHDNSSGFTLHFMCGVRSNYGVRSIRFRNNDSAPKENAISIDFPRSLPYDTQHLIFFASVPICYILLLLVYSMRLTVILLHFEIKLQFLYVQYT